MLKYSIILIVISFFACSEQKTIQTNTIVINDNNNFSIKNILDYQFIPLETTTESLLSSIRDVKIYDNKLFILDGKLSRVLVFNTSGKFIAQIGSLGEGPNEYLNVCTFHLDSIAHVITLADAVSCKLLHYQLNDYKLISTQKTEYFQECAWFSNGDIAWYLGNGFETEKRISYYIKITDNKLNHIQYLLPVDFSIQYGVAAGSFFYQNGGEIFLNIPFKSTVYHITSQKAEEHFTINLGNHKFAPLDWLKKEASKNYASAIMTSNYISACNIKETKNYISACFYAKGANGYICFYNKNTQSSCKYSGTDFIKLTGLVGIGHIKSVYNDYFITDISAGALKRNSISRQDLQEIAKNINEEDNPVLCLFKPK
ncbi:MULTISPECIES: 6-bladed beta-propeller [Parabacteroides]|uniref:6-bladed beta-propeller n=1 Tax=Parabacteroides provencensis TaxID=1944636 RepID=UPI000C148716|nr:6-bladed beta-propeller [Parabacteroides provencensis]